MIYFFLSCRAVDPSIGRRLISFLVHRSKVLLVLLCVGGFFSLSSIANAIEVGGHLTEDTTWSPDNNPYIVTSGVYVEEGVTLTILPGTVVKFNACLMDAIGNDDFWFDDDIESSAKFIRCEGNIIAEGTEDNNITFTRLQDEDYFCWGNIYFPEEAGFGSFKFCNFEYAAIVGYTITEQPAGALSIRSGNAIIENCTFIDNGNSIEIQSKIESIEISNNEFSIVGLIHPGAANVYFQNFMIIRYINENSTSMPLIANNVFIHGMVIFFTYPINFIDNEINYTRYSNPSLWVSTDEESSSYIFRNHFYNFSTGIWGSGNEESMPKLFIKANQFIRTGGQGYEGIDINYFNTEISNNYFEKCGFDSGLNSTGKVYNNIINQGDYSAPGTVAVFQNIGFNGVRGITVTYRNEYCNNNISINNEYAFNGHFSGYYNNCIFLSNDELSQNGIHGNPIFRNCILDFDLPEECIDGGGNIIVDSLQAQEIFEDIENGDFQLAENSIAIDAGFDSLGYYYPFDLENSVRVWDGDGDGRAVIDIGAYEYGAPQLGKITGYITETFTGEPVDYVLLKANNEPGEFTFADSSGYFEIQLPEGTYDLYAERVFYEDNILYTVTVENEQTTELNFNLTYDDPLVGISDNEINMSDNLLKTSNYPNPFNPTTTISFDLPADSEVSVEVYNLRGQKVKTLLNKKMVAGQNSVVWNGVDNNGSKVSSGIYFYQVKTKHSTVMKKIMLLK